MGSPPPGIAWRRASSRRYCPAVRASPDHSGAETDRVVADPLGMYFELVGFRNHRIDPVEQTLVERRKRIGRAGLAELLFGICDREGGRQTHDDGVDVLLDKLNLGVAFRHRHEHLRLCKLLLEFVDGGRDRIIIVIIEIVLAGRPGLYEVAPALMIGYLHSFECHRFTPPVACSGEFRFTKMRARRAADQLSRW